MIQIPEHSALLLVDIQDSRTHVSLYDGEYQQARRKFYH